MNQFARDALNQMGEAFDAYRVARRAADAAAAALPVRRTVVAWLPLLGGPAVAAATAQLIQALSDMGPCDWTTINVHVVGGQLVAQADAIEPLNHQAAPR